MSGWGQAVGRLDGHDVFGRNAELAPIEEAWQRAAAGDAVLRIVTGPAGVGKSALIAEAHECIGPPHRIGSDKYEQFNDGLACRSHRGR